MGWEGDFDKAAKDTANEKVVALMQEVFGVEVLPMRVKRSESHWVETLLDQRAGIDALAIDRDGDVFGIGWRLQWLDYGTFTVRAKRTTGAETEATKIPRLIEKRGRIRQHLMVQTYATPDGLHAGVAKVDEMYEWIAANRHDPKMVERKIAESDGNEFDTVRWWDIRGHDWFREYRERGQGWEQVPNVTNY